MNIHFSYLKSLAKYTTQFFIYAQILVIKTGILSSPLYFAIGFTLPIILACYYRDEIISSFKSLKELLFPKLNEDQIYKKHNNKEIIHESGISYIPIVKAYNKSQNPIKSNIKNDNNHKLSPIPKNEVPIKSTNKLVDQLKEMKLKTSIKMTYIGVDINFIQWIAADVNSEYAIIITEFNEGLEKICGVKIDSYKAAFDIIDKQPDKMGIFLQNNIRAAKYIEENIDKLENIVSIFNSVCSEHFKLNKKTEYLNNKHDQMNEIESNRAKNNVTVKRIKKGLSR